MPFKVFMDAFDAKNIKKEPDNASSNVLSTNAFLQKHFHCITKHKFYIEEAFIWIRKVIYWPGEGTVSTFIKQIQNLSGRFMGGSHGSSWLAYDLI